MQRGESEMLSRWCSQVHDLNLAFSNLHRLVQQYMPKKQGRGRKPKRNITKYIEIIVLKEYDERYLLVAVKYLNGEGFVITSFFTNKVTGLKWKKK